MASILLPVGIVGIVGLMGCGDDSAEGKPDSAEALSQEPAAAAPSRSQRLNIVLITLDTSRADAFGAYGQSWPTSPAIDRMAREGLLFEQATTASPSTLPSHATIMTGLFPMAHGVRSNSGYALHEDQITLAEILAGSGYVTAAEVAAAVIGRRTGMAQGFSKYREPNDFDAEKKKLRVADLTAPGGSRIEEAHDRDGADITKRGLEFLSAQSSSRRPFFLWLHYFDPHSTYQAPQEFQQGFESSPYHAEIRYADHQVGRILTRISELGLRDRTLVVLTADHGEGLGEHGEQTHSYFVYDTTMHVPLLFWGPKQIPRGRRIAAPVRTVDIAPSVLDWSGLPVPPIFQGTSLRGLTQDGAEASSPGPSYGETIEQLALFGSSMLRSYQEGPWKYIHKLNPELYRVDEDRGERKNLAGSKPERVNAMRKALEIFVNQSSAEDVASRGGLDAAQRAQLFALGYIGVETPEEFNDAEDLGSVVGPDPSTTQADLDLFLAAHSRTAHGEADSAIATFNSLKARYPDRLAIELGLLEALVETKGWEELVPVAKTILAQDAIHLKANEVLGAALNALQRDEEAEAHWRMAADAFPCDSGMSSRLGYFLMVRGREADRLDALDEALDRCPEEAAIKNDLSFLLSSSEQADLLDGQRALELAREAVASEHGQRPDFLDTLACAEARMGDFASALATLSRAEMIARRRVVPPAALEELASHRRAFTQRRPIGGGD